MKLSERNETTNENGDFFRQKNKYIYSNIYRFRFVAPSTRQQRRINSRRETRVAQNTRLLVDLNQGQHTLPPGASLYTLTFAITWVLAAHMVTGTNIFTLIGLKKIKDRSCHAVCVSCRCSGSTR